MNGSSNSFFLNKDIVLIMLKGVPTKELSVLSNERIEAKRKERNSQKEMVTLLNP